MALFELYERYQYTFDAKNDVKYDEYFELRRLGWKKRPRIGDLRNPHHGICYRIYNIDMENKAHKYNPKQVDHPKADFAALKAEYLARLPKPTTEGEQTLIPGQLPERLRCPANSLCD